MYEKVFAYLDAHAEDYAAQLCRWVEVPSVKGEAAPGAPFGKDVRRMLDMAMADAKAFGYETRDFDGYACDITLPGESEEAIAVLGHLDVVPAGDNWATPPFTATRVGDQIFARGTSDDKGPALAALYAMNAIKAAGIPLKKSIRLILGCDEESGWEDMAYYCAHTEMPEVGFSPDASFPIINTEKGMIHGFFTSKLAEDGLQVKQLWTGERVNVIPGESKALIAGGQEVADKVAAYAEKTGLPYTAEVTADGVWVTAEGIPGHSAYPEGRRNAIGMMLVLLREMGVTGALKTLADAVGMEHDGASLGCACSDEISGALTCNMGILHVKDGKVTASLDLRCPIAADLSALTNAIRAHLPGFSVDSLEIKEPHHVPADSKLVRSLLDSYTEVTGEPAAPHATGGGTYAKVLKQGVAYGAAFPEDEDLAHQANEYIRVQAISVPEGICCVSMEHSSRTPLGPSQVVMTGTPASAHTADTPPKQLAEPETLPFTEDMPSPRTSMQSSSAVNCATNSSSVALSLSTSFNFMPRLPVTGASAAALLSMRTGDFCSAAGSKKYVLPSVVAIFSNGSTGARHCEQREIIRNLSIRKEKHFSAARTFSPA